MRSPALLIFATALLSIPACAQHVTADGGAQSFHSLVDGYLSDVLYPYAPTNGTGAGLHQYDTQLEDYAPAHMAKETALTRDYQRKIQAIDASALPASVAADREIVLSNLAGSLLTLEAIKPWQKNPDVYSSGITGSAFSIMERPYAPVDTRLRALIAREKLMPHLLEEARTNLTNPPKSTPRLPLNRSTATSASSSRTCRSPLRMLPMRRRRPSSPARTPRSSQRCRVTARG